MSISTKKIRWQQAFPVEVHFTQQKLFIPLAYNTSLVRLERPLMLAWFCGTELMPFCASTSSYQQNMLAALKSPLILCWNCASVFLSIIQKWVLRPWICRKFTAAEFGKAPFNSSLVAFREDVVSHAPTHSGSLSFCRNGFIPFFFSPHFSRQSLEKTLFTLFLSELCNQLTSGGNLMMQGPQGREVDPELQKQAQGRPWRM